MPVKRVVTRNLLLSANRALTVERGEVTENNFQDLCTLLNLSMLEDSITTLGSSSWVFEDLKEMTGLQVNFVGPEQLKIDQVITRGVPELYDQLVKSWDLNKEPERELNNGSPTEESSTKESLSLDRLKVALERSLEWSAIDDPDLVSDFEEGFKAFVSDGTNIRASNFWLRSCLYRSLAVILRGALVLDAVRMWGIERPSPPRDDVISDMNELVEGKYYESTQQQTAEILPFKIPPFAAVILKLADNNRDEIKAMTRQLRDQLVGVRNMAQAYQGRLEADYQDNLLGKPHDATTRREMQDELRKALQSLSKVVVPLPEQVVELQPAYRLMASTAKLIKTAVEFSTTHPLQSAATTAKEMYSLATERAAYSNREAESAFLEIHRAVALRLFSKAKIKVTDMFGELIEDRPKRRWYGRWSREH